MKTIIVGGGKVGYYLTKTLLEKGYDVSVIESDRERGQLFSNELDVPVVWGDGTTEKALEKAGARKCETVIAITGRDETNLIVCQLAKKLYGVEKTITRVNNPRNTEAIKKLGVDIVVSSTDNIIRQLEREVDTSRIKELLPLSGGKASVMEITLPEDYALAHTEILQLSLPLGCNIISITRGGELIIPRGKTKLMGGDVMLIVVANSDVSELKRVLKLKK